MASLLTDVCKCLTASQVDNLERRLSAAEVREARLMAEVREAEAVAAEREELAVAVAALRERLEETRAERGQLEQYKKVRRDSQIVWSCAAFSPGLVTLLLLQP